MPDLYPKYDVLAKRQTLSWNDKTRQVINDRLAVPREPRFLEPALFAILEAVAARIVPQPKDRPPVPVASYVDQKLFRNELDGYRLAQLPEQREAYRRGLGAMEETAQRRHGQCFVQLAGAQQDAILADMQAARLKEGIWAELPSDLFFTHRLLQDLTTSYWAHPAAWSEMGFGGPAAPRGYVRMQLDRRDPWEAVEAKPGEEARAARENRRVR